MGQERKTAQIGARDALLEDLGRTYNSHMVERLGLVINGCLGLQSTLLRTGDQQSVQKPLVSSISKRPIQHPTPGKPSTAASQKAFNALRLIVTIGWAIYPIGYVVGYTGGGSAEGLNIIYNLADFVNKIAFGVVIWAAATADSKS